MCIIDPLNPQYTPFKLDSHLTDAQTQEERIRYLGIQEIDRKLMYLASQVAPCIGKQSVIFCLDAYFQALTHLSTFIQYLQHYGVSTINIQFTQASVPATYTCEETKIAENLYFSDEVRRVKEAGALLEAAKTCSHAGDYYSAINLLVALKDTPITDKWLETGVYLHLALCYRLIEKSIQSEFYYNLCVTSGNFRQKNNALYALSMIYLRHHTSKHLDISRGTQYLQQAYQLLLKEPDSERIQVDRVFNRNALALVLLKKGI